MRIFLFLFSFFTGLQLTFGQVPEGFISHSVQKGETLNLLDFGCVRIFDPKFIDAVI